MHRTVLCFLSHFVCLAHAACAFAHQQYCNACFALATDVPTSLCEATCAEGDSSIKVNRLQCEYIDWYASCAVARAHLAPQSPFFSSLFLLCTLLAAPTQPHAAGSKTKSTLVGYSGEFNCTMLSSTTLLEKACETANEQVTPPAPKPTTEGDGMVVIIVVVVVVVCILGVVMVVVAVFVRSGSGKTVSNVSVTVENKGGGGGGGSGNNDDVPMGIADDTSSYPGELCCGGGGWRKKWLQKRRYRDPLLTRLVFEKLAEAGGTVSASGTGYAGDYASETGYSASGCVCLVVHVSGNFSNAFASLCGNNKLQRICSPGWFRLGRLVDWTAGLNANGNFSIVRHDNELLVGERRGSPVCYDCTDDGVCDPALPCARQITRRTT